jgi:hypothetical protein
LKVYATKGNGKEKRELDTEMIISTKKEWQKRSLQETFISR